MFDRVPENPGRVKITPENGGAAYYATMERADNPVQEGTPLNKETLLTDETAALFGLGDDAVPNDVLAKTAKVVMRPHVYPRIVVTSIGGATAKAEKDGHICEGKEVESGAYEIDVDDYGTWTVSIISTVNGETQTQTVEVDTATLYPIEIKFDISVSATATSGKTYTDGLAGLSFADLDLMSEAIRANSAITYTASEIYIDYPSIDEYRHVQIGDGIDVEVDGSIYNCQVMGFNHYSKAGFVFLSEHSLPYKCAAFASSNYSSNGWKTSPCRTYLTNTVLPSLSEELSGVIKTVSVVSPVYDSKVTTSDKLFIPSHSEMGFTGAGFTEAEDGKAFQYFTAGNSKAKTLLDGTAVGYNLRTMSTSSSGFGYYVNKSGEKGSHNAYLASEPYYVVMAFCI